MRAILLLQTASNAIIIGFNVRPTPQAKIQAESDQVDIRLHRIIYNVIDEIENSDEGYVRSRIRREDHWSSYRS